jgi:hypothetical protein
MRAANTIVACSLLAACVSQPALVQRPEPTAADSVATSNRAKLPRFNTDNVKPWYPTAPFSATEVVDVEFSIDRQGHAKDLKQTYAASPDLGALASAYVQQRVFRVPADWEATGSENQRFTIEVQFSTRCPPVGIKPRVADAPVIETCAQRR